jgi:hypothetical protein
MSTTLATLSGGTGWDGQGFSFSGGPAALINSTLASSYSGGMTPGFDAFGATIANLGPAGFTLGGQTFNFAGADLLALRLGGPILDFGGQGGLGLSQTHNGVFTMNIGDVTEVYINGNAAQAKGGLAMNVWLHHTASATAGITGSVFNDVVQLNGGAAGSTSFVALGLGNDVFTGGGGSMDIVIGGHGDDILLGGAGSDQLFGDADGSGYAGDVQFIGNKAELGALDDNTYVSAIVELGYLGSESGFNNLVGYYYRENGTGDRVGKVMFQDDQAFNKGILIRDLTVAEAETLQFFVIANGANQNNAVLNNALFGGAAGRADGLLGSGNTGIDIRVEVASVAGGIGGTIGQVVLDTDGLAGDSDGAGVDGTVLRSQLSNGLGGTGLQLVDASGRAVTFSAFFTENALNPFARDYSLDFGLNETGVNDATAALTGVNAIASAAEDFTFNAVYTAAQINNGTIANASIVNHAVMQQNNLWGQIGMEDLFQGTGALNTAGTAYTNNRTDRDFDDVVFQSRVYFELAQAGGADVLDGGADAGSFSLTWSLQVTYQPGSSDALFNSGFGYYTSTSATGTYTPGDLLQGWLVDGSVLSGTGTEYATNPAITAGGDNTYTISGLDAAALQSLRWFLMPNLGRDDLAAPTRVLIQAESFDPITGDLVTAGNDLASRVHLDNGAAGVLDSADVALAGNALLQSGGVFSQADLNYNNPVMVGEAVQNANGRWVIRDASFAAGLQPANVPNLLTFTGTIGIAFEDGDRDPANAGGAARDFNDAVFTVTRSGPTLNFTQGDVLNGGAGADDFIWNRGSGFDTVTDFNIAEGDELIWGPTGTPYRVLVDADGGGTANDLLIAETISSTEGVLLLNLGTTTLGAWFV